MNISLVCPEHGIHKPWLPTTARGLRIAGLTDQEIFDALREATRNARRPVPDSEIKAVIALVFDTNAKNLNLDGSLCQKPVYEPAYLEERAARIPDTIDAEYLEARSQFTCWNRTPAGFLNKIFQPGENAWITTNEKSGRGLIWTHDGANSRFDELDHLTSGHTGVWFLTNPIDGELHAVDRRQSDHNPEGLSYMVIECVTSWRYLLIESDDAPAELWLKALAQFRLAIVAIYSSGKRSIHALVRVDAKSKADWDSINARYERELVRLGACEGALTARRLSRLPNCTRGETGLLQQLLYLRPDADSTPICQIPVRESADALEKRIRETHAGVIHNYETP